MVSAPGRAAFLARETRAVVAPPTVPAPRTAPSGRSATLDEGDLLLMPTTSAGVALEAARRELSRRDLRAARPRANEARVRYMMSSGALLMTYRSNRPALSATLLAALLSFGLTACTAAAEPPIANKVDMKVTEKGFEPKNIRVKGGEPVVLTITRTTDVTCGTEIVIDEYKVNEKLPLNQPVTVTFTPTKSGELRYGCAMKKMVGGVIKVM
jgi:plastocyanin